MAWRTYLTILCTLVLLIASCRETSDTEKEGFSSVSGETPDERGEQPPPPDPKGPTTKERERSDPLNRPEDPSHLKVEPYLDPIEVKAVMGIRDEVQPTRLQGIETSRTYDSARLQLAGNAENYGVALQVWRFDNPRKATEQFEIHQRTYPEVEVTQDLGSRSIRGKRRHIMHLSWIVDQSHTVYTLTCDDRFCPSWEQLVKLGKSITKRME